QVHRAKATAPHQSQTSRKNQESRRNRKANQARPNRLTNLRTKNPRQKKIKSNAVGRVGSIKASIPANTTGTQPQIADSSTQSPRSLSKIPVCLPRRASFRRRSTRTAPASSSQLASVIRPSVESRHPRPARFSPSTQKFQVATHSAR